MKCKSCKKDIGTKIWKYCPHCGTSLSRKPIYTLGMQDIFNKIFYSLQKSLMKNLLLSLENSANREQNSSLGGFKVKIITNKGFMPQKTEQATKKAEENHELRTTTRPVPKETIEPETKITELQDKQKIYLTLPGIQDLDDIDIIELENSCEIRAYKENRLYFKIIRIPEKLNLTEKKLDKERLILEFAS